MDPRERSTGTFIYSQSISHRVRTQICTQDGRDVCRPGLSPTPMDPMPHPGGESKLRESSNGVLWASGSVGTEFHILGLRILWMEEERRGKEKGAVRKVASPL